MIRRFNLCQYIKHPEVDTNGVNQVRYILARELKKKLKSKAEQLMLTDTEGSELITSLFSLGENRYNKM